MSRFGFDLKNPTAELTHEQMRLLVWAIMEVEVKSEAEHDLLVNLFCKYCKHPAESDLIYWPDHAGFDRELDCEEVVRLAMGESLEGESTS
jgi:hypothetical protein